eukprot:2842863-Ditylum_brightwellii.AAC.1
MFLTLTNEGSLILTQQLKECPEEQFAPVNGTETEICRYTLWSSDSHGDSSAINVLHLGHGGILRIVDITSHRVLWKSTDEANTRGTDEYHHHALDDIKKAVNALVSKSESPSCIESGSQDDINKALSGLFAEAVLCPGATFELTAPIIYTNRMQS